MSCSIVCLSVRLLICMHLTANFFSAVLSASAYLCFFVFSGEESAHLKSINRTTRERVCVVSL